jgi:hypothetical protein
LWESYSAAEEHFKDLVPKAPFSEGALSSPLLLSLHVLTIPPFPTIPLAATVHPNLFVSAQIPNNTYGRLMCIQMITAIAGEMWYYQYGRVQIGMLGAAPLWNVRLAFSFSSFLPFSPPLSLLSVFLHMSQYPDSL